MHTGSPSERLYGPHMLPNHSKSNRAKDRRGITAMGVIFGSVALFCLLALAVDVALILNGHQQMLGGCELAARAGTPYLIDTELEGSNLDTRNCPFLARRSWATPRIKSPQLAW